MAPLSAFRDGRPRETWGRVQAAGPCWIRLRLTLSASQEEEEAGQTKTKPLHRPSSGFAFGPWRRAHHGRWKVARMSRGWTERGCVFVRVCPMSLSRAGR